MTVNTMMSDLEKNCVAAE
ncbi:uncharacterized protein CELE_T22B7.22 [Caenorhabditis elegans]|uniref:Uncharacterized protein n=1 Tax=Caenorhabditis elegans TaxID=6239 RepID=A0A2K5AU21_CAEEL|nr:Uncharacterized protein CELE_T22B7.22 [Caenorhabditis elegans]SPC48680.1 Uncharacterized protein CELE_T22B7.22 [Caenorhabditis elegans]|eukprot:NP_001348819.1 Uncharacterized protein CELE_T22B7.22 [Caenorhabditis elegans]